VVTTAYMSALRETLIVKEMVSSVYLLYNYRDSLAKKKRLSPKK